MQPLYEAALRLLFDDVRTKDYVPEYAGGKSRVDCLLKAEAIVAETKMTRERLKHREVGEELAIDIKRYQATPIAQLS